MPDDKRTDAPERAPINQPPAADRGARAAEDKRAAEANREAAEQQAAVSPFTAEQLVTPAATGAGTRAMWIIVGPYKGTVLTMPDAEAEDAKDSHWAIEMADMAPPFDADKPLDHDHELTDEDRAHAVEAANAWAAKVNPPPEPPPEADGTRKEALTPDRDRGGYQTRDSEPSRRTEPERKTEPDPTPPRKTEPEPARRK